MTKPRVCWRISVVDHDKTTDQEGFSLMRIDTTDGRPEQIDLKVVDYGVGSFQDRTNMVQVNLYIDRQGQWYISAQL